MTAEVPVLDVREVDAPAAVEFIRANHYSQVLPRLTKVRLGGYLAGQLVAVATLGWGTRPRHTIQKLFPSLGTRDYLELGKLCLHDSLPRNSESRFLAQVLAWLRAQRPGIKLLFTWADGILGKPGYVYQASNAFYGGFIVTEAWLNPVTGDRVHVRSLQGHPGLPMAKARPGARQHFKTRSLAALAALGFVKVFGYQFRYAFPLCNRRAWRRLTRESTVTWARGPYPKAKDCRWWCQAAPGAREELPACPFGRTQSLKTLGIRTARPTLIEALAAEEHQVRAALDAEVDRHRGARVLVRE